MSVFGAKNRSLASLVIGVVLISVASWQLVQWTLNRWYVPEGYSLMLQYKGPLPLEFYSVAKLAKPGHFAQADETGSPLEVGVLERMPGPGRHFYCPIWWVGTLVKDVRVEAGKVAVFKSNLGGDLPPGEFLVDGELGETKHKGILRRVYGPGVYRVNPYAYSHEIIETQRKLDGNQEKVSGWVDIPTGYVGVVTNQTPNPLTNATAGIQAEVFPPGLYPINPREQQVDIVEIGFREKSVSVEKRHDAQGNVMVDENGEVEFAHDSGGISFPSNDGFTIFMDFTAIWGIMPDQAAETIAKFGNVKAVEDKVVLPQIESICRNKGSELGAVELLVGQSRQDFQIETSDAFKKALEDKDLTLQQGLVRYIYIPQEIRKPIQTKYLADELTLTREQEELTAKTEAELRKAEKQVELEAARIGVETEKLVAEEIATGEKAAAETRANTIKMTAEINRQTAELEAQATVELGRADADAQTLLEEAKAGKFKLAVSAFGSGQAYNQYVFASGLPKDIKLNMLYAGEGTFWTDLKGFSETMLGRQAQQKSQPSRPQVGPQPPR